MKPPVIPRIETGVRNLDALLHGGLPKGSVSVFGGSPGAGKTILAQQICFHHASATRRVLWFSTLSEPTAKTLRHLSQFSFFDRGKVDAGELQFIDLGVILRARGLDESSKLIMQHIKEHKPALAVIDSFKVFDDLAQSREEQRKFSYELLIQLMAWETPDILVDGNVLMMKERIEAVGARRVAIDSVSVFMPKIAESSVVRAKSFQLATIDKLRNTSHATGRHELAIGAGGITVVPRERAAAAPRSSGPSRAGRTKPRRRT